MSSTSALLADLEAMPASRRGLALRNCSRFHTASLCQEMARRSFAARFSASEEMVAWAEAAVLVASALPESDAEADAITTAWANLGNARRIQGRLREADHALQRARQAMTTGTGSSELEDHVDSLEGTLRVFQRRFPEALEILGCLASRRGRRGDTLGQARALLQIGSALVAAERPEEAAVLLVEALRVLQVVPDLELERLATCALVFAYLRAGRPEWAESLWSRSDLYMSGAALLTRTRWLWGRGLIDLETSFPGPALAKVRKAREIFAAEGLRFDAALTTLDLVLCLVRLEDLGSARVELEAALILLLEIGAPRETLVAVRGLLDLEDRKLTVQRISAAARRVRRYGYRLS
jgi:tetratricopeptide (TPR) repeat protein